MILNILSAITNKVYFHYEQLFKPDLWNIGIVEQPIQSLVKDNIDPSKITWMPSPKSGEYLADPFAIIQGDTVKVYFEHYNYGDRRGQISTSDFKDKKWSNQFKTVLAKDYHISYPYLVEHDNSFYCIPETAENNQVDLYSIDSSSGDLKYEKTLLENTNARDTSVFEYNGYWWLFCTLKEDPNSKLHIYYSKELFGPYSPHQNNPVKDDIKSARSAGTPFFIDDTLYRPAQDCSASYGGQVSINRILRLSPEEFEETHEKTIGPIQGTEYNMGIHTISKVGDRILIDGKRASFVWANFTFQLNRKIKKVLGTS